MGKSPVGVSKSARRAREIEKRTLGKRERHAEIDWERRDMGWETALADERRMWKYMGIDLKRMKHHEMNNLKKEILANLENMISGYYYISEEVLMQIKPYVPLKMFEFITNEYENYIFSKYRPEAVNYQRRELARIQFPPKTRRSKYNTNFEDDPPICLRGVGSVWHLIKPGNLTPQNTFLENIFPPEPKHMYFAAPVSVGSRIYLIGGYKGCTLSPVGSVYYTDTTSLGQRSEWDEGPFLPEPAPCPSALVLHKGCTDNNEGGWVLLVLNTGAPRSNPYNHSCDAHFLEEGASCWRTSKSELPSLMTSDTIGPVTAHVIERRGHPDHLLVHYSDSPKLYKFDFSSGQWDLASKNLGLHFNATALVGGILYTMSVRFPGHIFALDTSSSLSLKKKFPVKLIYPDDQFWWLPQEDEHNFCSPNFFMVPLGINKLAIIWHSKAGKGYFPLKDDRPALVIWCTRWKVSRADSATGAFELKAYSRARYFSDAALLMNCLSV